MAVKENFDGAAFGNLLNRSSREDEMAMEVVSIELLSVIIPDNGEKYSEFPSIKAGGSFYGSTHSEALSRVSSPYRNRGFQWTYQGNVSV